MGERRDVFLTGILLNGSSISLATLSRFSFFLRLARHGEVNLSPILREAQISSTL